MEIHIYEDSVRARACAALINKGGELADLRRVILLPIPTTRDGIRLTGSEKWVDEALEQADGETLVVAYGLPSSSRARLEERGSLLLDCSLDEDFLVANGELTAEATLGILLNTEPRAPRDLSVGVVGYGRIGKHVTALLLYLGANVRVYTSREGTRLELCEFGVASRMSLADADLSGLDLLINTAPAKIFGTSGGVGIPEGLRIIDLASGDNFPEGVKVERYPSLPAKMFPYSAGRIWYESIERFLKKGYIGGEA